MVLTPWACDATCYRRRMDSPCESTASCPAFPARTKAAPLSAGRCASAYASGHHACSHCWAARALGGLRPRAPPWRSAPRAHCCCCCTVCWTSSSLRFVPRLLACVRTLSLQIGPLRLGVAGRRLLLPLALLQRWEAQPVPCARRTASGQRCGSTWLRKHDVGLLAAEHTSSRQAGLAYVLCCVVFHSQQWRISQT
jgi:hypothetical protein